MMLGTEQFAALGVMFTVLFIAFVALALLYMVKEIVKEKVDWWHRKWRMEGKLDELERRISSLEEANGPRGGEEDE